jgi:hypothetical protein
MGKAMTGMRVRSAVKAGGGGWWPNHNQAAVLQETPTCTLTAAPVQ